MAKLRVYELAKNLNMTNKALMTKIEKMGIMVGSHMSTLEEDTMELIKSNLFGKKESDVDEKRVRSTVIRRRKKLSETGEELPDDSPDLMDEGHEEEAQPKEVSTGIRRRTKEPAVIDNDDAANVDEGEDAADDSVVIDASDTKPQTTAAKKSSFEAARIIRKPVEKPVQPEEIQDEEATVESTDDALSIESEMVQSDAEEADGDISADDDTESSEDENETELSDTAENITESAGSDDDDKNELKKKKKKKLSRRFQPFQRK